MSVGTGWDEPGFATHASGGARVVEDAAILSGVAGLSLLGCGSALAVAGRRKAEPGAIAVEVSPAVAGG